MPETPNDTQIDYWNTVAGATWVKYQAQLDRQIEPLGLEAMQVLRPAPGEAVLDVGCGCGQTTVTLAERLGGAGSVIGVDISRPMLEVARGRPVPRGAARPEFREADAQIADLGRAVFDAVYSRFGVMFFADPTAAFANIRSAMKPGGRLTFVCWRKFEENLWMRAPMEAALPLLPPLPPPNPTAPGPFAFADPERVAAILRGAGFKTVTTVPFDTLIGGSSVDEAVEMAFRVGPLGAALRDNPALAPTVAEAVRRSILPFETPAGVLMPAAVWIVQARA